MARTRTVPKQTRDELLEALFGATKDTASAVLEVVESDRTRTWQADEVVDTTGFRPMEVMVVLARLAAVGVVRHDALGGGYRAPADGATSETS